jgi:hypothetical protein
MTEGALVDLRVRLLPCRACGCVSATIAQRNVIRCDCCQRKRGRVGPDTQRFLNDFIALFGRPTAPIEIRQSTETSPQLSGAAAEDVA